LFVAHIHFWAYNILPHYFSVMLVELVRGSPCIECSGIVVIIVLLFVVLRQRLLFLDECLAV